ncbi:MAG: AAA family ATPase [Planctomycetota bacterium]
MSYVRRIGSEVYELRRSVEFDLSPRDDRPFCHLILTGPNGSGKTVALKSLYEALVGRRPINVEFTGPAPNLSPVLFEARRELSVIPAGGPTTQIAPATAGQLEQVLVNLRTQQSYAREEGKEAEAQAIGEQLASYERLLQDMFEQPGMRLEFSRKQIRYFLRLDGRLVQFQHLPDGFKNVLELWATLWAVLNEVGVSDSLTAVFIDEVETHLHLSLQEKVLPFLTRTFPQAQFFVTTHSPAVLASIDGAVIYDLGRPDEERLFSDDLRGVRYGTVMTEHFGISSDFDLRTTRDLAELHRLRKAEQRTPEETQRMRLLARALSEHGHALAYQVLYELERAAAKS